MKTWGWRTAYALLVYTGFVVALNTTWELQERREPEPECQVGCCW